MRYDVLNLLLFFSVIVMDGLFFYRHSVDFVSSVLFLFCFRAYSWFSFSTIFFSPILIGMASDFYRWGITANEITSAIEHGFFSVLLHANRIE